MIHEGIMKRNHDGSNFQRLPGNQKKYFASIFSIISRIILEKQLTTNALCNTIDQFILYEFRFLWDHLIRQVIERVTVRKTLGPKVLGNCYLHGI